MGAALRELAGVWQRSRRNHPGPQDAPRGHWAERTVTPRIVCVRPGRYEVVFVSTLSAEWAILPLSLLEGSFVCRRSVANCRPATVCETNDFLSPLKPCAAAGLKHTCRPQSAAHL